MTKKQKPVYTITAFQDITSTAVYSCLKTLCEEWNVLQRYTTIWRWLKAHDAPYNDGEILVKRHLLIRSTYKRKTTS